MIEIETYFRDDIELWRAYFNKLPPEYQGVYNSPEYIAFLETAGMGKAVCQIFREKDHFVYFPALMRPLPFHFRGCDLTSSWYYGGPVPNWQNLKPLTSVWTQAIIKGRLALDAVCEFIRCDPNLKNHELINKPFHVRHDRPTVIVNLKVPWREVVGGFSSQNRRNVKTAEKNGLIVEVDQSETAWMKFAHIYQTEMVRKSAPSHLRFADDFFLHLSKLKGFTLFLVKAKEEVIGGFVSAYGAQIAHHYLSAVKYDHWDKRPNNLLFTQVLAHFHREGYKIFDFQGGREGVFRFKENFSKLRGAFYTASCVYDKEKFGQLTDRVGENESEFFPPYRVT